MAGGILLQLLVTVILEPISSDEKRGVASDAAPTGAAHCEQNLAEAGSSLSHLAQRAGSGAAHSGQNFARGGASCWQRGHCMALVIAQAPTATCLTRPAGGPRVRATGGDSNGGFHPDRW